MITVNKSFQITSKATGVDENGSEWIEVSGYASKMYEDGKLVIDSDLESIDAYGIDLSRLQGGILPLLLGHDQNQAVGKVMEASYTPDGLKVIARVYKLPNDSLTNYAYEAVKAGIISAFSVGIIVKDFDVVTQDGEDYLQLAKSEIIELSLVAVPSNPKATFQIMNINEATKSVSIRISKSALKPENPNICEEIGNCTLVKNKGQQMKTKDATEQEIIKDNVSVEPEDVTESEPPKETEETQPAVTEEVVGTSEEKLVDTPEDKVEEPIEEEEVTTPKEEPKVEEPKVEEEEPEVPTQITFSEAMDAISDIDMDELSFDDIETLYEFADAVKEHIEAKVVAEVISELGN